MKAQSELFLDRLLLRGNSFDDNLFAKQIQQKICQNIVFFLRIWLLGKRKFKTRKKYNIFIQAQMASIKPKF